LATRSFSRIAAGAGSAAESVAAGAEDFGAAPWAGVRRSEGKPKAAPVRSRAERVKARRGADDEARGSEDVCMVGRVNGRVEVCSESTPGREAVQMRGHRTVHAVGRGAEK
jgi:hypothetical protein